MDNTTPMQANDYDKNIENTLPFYHEFHKQTIDLVKSLHLNCAKWLDTGCGTGTLIAEALEEFPDFGYTLCDPSEAMLAQAKAKLSHSDKDINYFAGGSQDLQRQNEFDIITAILSHHYLKWEDRISAVQNCYNALKKGGVFIFFEHFKPNHALGHSVVMDRWGRYQKAHGKTASEVVRHQQRYGNDYFPISLQEHFDLLSGAGYSEIEIFWLSYMQVGIYALK